MKRRNFLENSLSLLGLYSLTQMPFTSFAASQAPPEDSRFLISLRVPGGIDTLLSSDPLLVQKTMSRDYLQVAPSDWWQLYRDSDLIQSGSNIFGPAMAPIKEFLPDLSVVNGIVMLPRDVSHENNLKHFDHSEITRPEPIAVEISKYLKPTPISVVTNTNLTGMTQLSSLGNSLNSQNHDLSDYAEALLQADDDIDGMTATDNSLMKSRAVVRASGSTVQQKVESAQAKAKIKKNNLEVIQQIFSAFQTGISQVAVLNYAPFFKLDTHEGHDKYHQKSLEEVFGFFAELIRSLKNTPLENGSSKSLFDVTTVVMYSEFARSAFREKVSGTAHNPFNNSVWMTGGRIKGGQKIGGSDLIPASSMNDKKLSSLHALPFNFDTQSPIQLKEWFAQQEQINFARTTTDANSYDYIKPNHIWATVAETLGIKNSSVSQNRLLKKILKS